MGKILVAGGLWDEDPDKSMLHARRHFAIQLGKEIISKGHTLLGGCRTQLDAEVANAAAIEAKNRKIEPKKVIKSWVSESTKPVHSSGEIIRSKMIDWGKVPRGLAFPEPIQEADVVIILGGWDGTHFAASWARIANKPIVPVASFGQAAAEIFDDEIQNFDRRYASRVTMDDFQILNRLLSDLGDSAIELYTKDILSLAERLITPTNVFIIMSFAEKPHLIDAYNTCVRVCKDNNFNAFKVDHHIDAKQRIVPTILNSIKRSAFIIADVSEPKPNVYYELGYAQALGKDMIVTAQEGTILPFDIFDIPTIFWNSQYSLEQKLKEQIIELSRKFGRQVMDQ